MTGPAPKLDAIPLRIKDAKALTGGGLTDVSKMPCKTYNTPASACVTGSKLRKVAGSTCSDCYACKGNFQFRSAQAAMQARLATIGGPNWVTAMVTLIAKQSRDFFRWHSSGDIQSVSHFADICKVAELTPDTAHWIPTREAAIVAAYKRAGGTIPANLCVRISATMIDQRLPARMVSSMVIDKRQPAADVHVCPAPEQNGYCGDCRACWDPSVKTVGYHRH